MTTRRTLAILLFAALAFPALADRGGYVIRSFATELTVLRTGDVDVRETIDVAFSEPRHGIYRSIPVSYTDPRGYRYSLGLRLLGVEDASGRSWQVKTSRSGAYVNIRIGSPDRTVSGPATYVVRYRVRDALVARPEHDELYWNATGNEWQTTIDRASAVVRLPGPIERSDLETAGYVGRFGSRDTGVAIDASTPGIVKFAAPGRLEPLEGLTVAVAWPKGVVQRPGPIRSVLRFLGDNWILLVPIVVLAFLVRTWFRRGRDPRGRGSVVVRYEPPQDVRPGELGTVVDERADLRDITATVVDLGVRGFLRIEIEETKHLFGLLSSEAVVFQRVAGTDDSALRDHERKVLDALFERGDRVTDDDLKNRFYRHVAGIRDALYERVTEAGLFAGKPSTVRKTWVGLGVVAGLAVFGIGAGWVKLRGGIFPNAIVVPLVSGIATLVLFALFARAMPRRTARGVAVREWALGFEEFTERVEGERLERDRARNVFETLLPYAMALGIAAAWARRFEGIYTEAGPAWFAGGDPARGFSTLAFERSLSTAMTRAGSAMTQAPRSQGSSGSGGGGFSGGGGGGGGGGSW